MNKKIDKKEKIRTSLIIFLVLISFIFLLETNITFSANENLTLDKAGLVPYVDPNILKAFGNASEVPVIVKVRDTSGISISSNDSIEQQNIKDLQRKEFLGSNTDSVLSKLPTDGFKLKGKFITGRGFYGSITKAAFDKLVNDSDVGAIYLDSVEDLGGWKVPTEKEPKSDGAVTSANTSKYDPEILDAFNNQTWVRVSVVLVDISNITVSGSKDERRALLRQRDELLRVVVKEVVATLSQDEFESFGESSDWFGGRITKKGFDKLVNDTRVSAIYIDKPVYAASYDNETLYGNLSMPKNKTESQLITIPSEPSSKFQKIKKNDLLLIAILLILLFSILISHLVRKKEKDGKRH